MNKVALVSQTLQFILNMCGPFKIVFSFWHRLSAGWLTVLNKAVLSADA